MVNASAYNDQIQIAIGHHTKQTMMRVRAYNNYKRHNLSKGQLHNITSNP